MKDKTEGPQALLQDQVLKFGIYSLNCSTRYGLTVSRHFIVLTEGKRILSFTRLESLCQRGSPKIVHYYSSSSRSSLVYVVEFLNWMLQNYPETPAVQIPWSFSPEDLQEFFWAYSSRKLNENTIKKCMYYLTDFAAGIAAVYPDSAGFGKEDLYEEQIRRYDRNRTSVHRKILFSVSTPGKVSMPFRDMPIEALALLIRLAWAHTPDIAFAICTQAFSGIREGEVLSMRQTGSCYGSGIELVWTDGKLPSAVHIDINTEYALREDGAQPVHIKIRRKAHVYPGFIPVFMNAWEIHEEFLKKHPHDTKRAPMFIDRQGQAMSYATYRNRFDTLVNDHFRPALLKCGDKDLQAYGNLLLYHSLTLHSLRHFFSQHLVLCGESLEVLMNYRGDKNPESCLVYLRGTQNSLRKRHDSAQDLLLSLLPNSYDRKKGDTAYAL